MTTYAYREWRICGGKVVSPEFSTAAEAGRWIRDNPPLGDCGPTLVRIEDGEQRVVLDEDLIDALMERLA